MFKWLLLLVGAYLFYLWLKGKKQIKFNQRNAAKPSSDKAPESMEPETMVSCQYCNVHLPKSEAMTYEQRFYCSSEHLHALDRQGWIGSAKWRISPNQDVRPENIPLDLAVIHHISLPPGEFGGRNIVDFFQNNLDPKAHPYFEQIANQKVSSHFLIDRRGKTTQFVSLHKRAWHAGVSQFCGREKCNDFSIGIELEGDGDTPFTNEQYASLAEVTGVLLKKYPDLQFAGHSDIAPERKTDPGPSFDWVRLTKIAKLSEEKLPFGSASR